MGSRGTVGQGITKSKRKVDGIKIRVECAMVSALEATI
jgi:hypothetical protein